MFLKGFLQVESRAQMGPFSTFPMFSNHLFQTLSLHVKYIFNGHLNHSAFVRFPKVKKKQSTCSISCSLRITVSGETRGILGRAGE